MLQLILGAKQNSDDLQMGFNIASFIVAVLWKTASVYGVCIFVIVRSFRALLKIRNGATFTANRFHVHTLALCYWTDFVTISNVHNDRSKI